MMRLAPDDILHLGLGDAEFGGQLGDQGVPLGLVLLLEIATDLLHRGAQLGLGDAELLGQRRGARATRTTGTTGAAAKRRAGAAGARTGPQVVERGAQLGLADAQLLGEIAEAGLGDAAVGAGLERVERRADLRGVDAELGRQRLVEAVEPIAATIAADDLAVPVELLECGGDLGLIEAEPDASAFASASWCSSFLVPGPGRRSCSAARSFASVTPSLAAMPERSRGPAGRPGRGRAALAGVGLPPASAVPSPVCVPSA